MRTILRGAILVGMVAKYNGSGDVTNAASFSCVAP